MQLFSSATTLGAPSKPVEIKIPLWWADGSGVSTTVSSASLLMDGAVTVSSTGAPPSSTNLHTLSSKWSTGTKFALEATVWVSNSAGTMTAEIWDITAGGAIYSITTAATTATVIRSGQFTLTSGHTYGVAIYGSNSSYTYYICDASLIVFP